MQPQEIKQHLGLEIFTEQPDLEELMKSDSPNAYYACNAEKEVIGLNLCGQGLTDDKIAFLWDMPQLQALNLSENKLSNVSIPAKMQDLYYLNLSENGTLAGVTFSTGLPVLEELDISECNLSELTLPKGFAALKTLDLQKNKLTQVTFEGDCPALVSLDLSQNQLEHLDLLQGFRQLAYLYLNDNQLKRLYMASVHPSLETLHLRNNQFTELPNNFLLFTNLETVYLYGNPLSDIPKEVLATGERDNSLESIRNYLRGVQKGGEIPLRQAKMILVGNGEVGKTSIRLKLIDEEAELPKKENRTQGLDIATYTITGLEKEITDLDEDIDFQLNIWDFGGQGKYREVQQLFCSRKSLYLFVTAFDDTPEKEDYVGYEYWLSMVNAYGYDAASEQSSPVIYVVNKIDREKAKTREVYWSELFPNIHDFIKISCKTRQNFAQLEQTIRQALPKVSSDIFTSKFPEHWLRVKTELDERRKENHISYQEYEGLCGEHGMDEGEARSWIAMMDRIGSIIYFGDHPELKQWVILNPEWVKDAMFKVLDSPFVEGGVLKPTFYAQIWPDYEHYAEEERQKLMALMLQYKLAYAQQNEFGEVEYIVPSRLRDQKPSLPAHLQQPNCQLKFDYSPFIPAGTVSKLMVDIQTQGARSLRPTEGYEGDMPGKLVPAIDVSIYRNYKWKNNVIVQDASNNAYAHVTEDWESKTVYLDLFGGQVEPLYHLIEEMLQQINKTLRDTKYLSRLELRPLGWYKEKWLALSDLEIVGIDFFKNKPHVDLKNNTPMEQIKQLVAQGRLDQALKELAAALPSHLQNERLQLEGRLNELQKKNRLGILDSAEYDRLLNKVRVDILDLCDSSTTGTSTIAVTPSIASGQKKILFVAANPDNASRIQTDQEHRLLKAQLERGRMRDQYLFLPPQLAVTATELIRAMRDKPEIIHFSGHGNPDGIVITTEDNKGQTMAIPALQRLFRPLRDIAQIIILNACYSAPQAKALSEFGIYVVGNNLPINDSAAISFSEGLYLGFGEGKNFEDAFNDAMTVVLTKDPDAASIIEVWKDGEKLDL